MWCIAISTGTEIVHSLASLSLSVAIRYLMTYQKHEALVVSRYTAVSHMILTNDTLQIPAPSVLSHSVTRVSGDAPVTQDLPVNESAPAQGFPVCDLRKRNVCCSLSTTGCTNYASKFAHQSHNTRLFAVLLNNQNLMSHLRCPSMIIQSQRL